MDIEEALFESRTGISNLACIHFGLDFFNDFKSEFNMRVFGRHAFTLIIVLLPLFPLAAHAVPAEIILVRHAETIDSYKLSHLGQTRAEALAKVYLGKNASHGILPHGKAPAALMTMTLHNIETAAPTALSWGMPQTAFAVVPEWDLKHSAKKREERASTRHAAHELLNAPQYDGKVVVVIWAHSTIASAKLEAEHPGKAVTFRQLLHLNRLPNVPKTWPKYNYDYFWIVKYHGDNPVPVSFQMKKERYGGKYANLPQNDWGKPGD